jgi:hypothetical protein
MALGDKNTFAALWRSLPRALAVAAFVYLAGVILWFSDASAADSTWGDCCPTLKDDVWARDTLAVGVVWHSADSESVFDRPQAINLIEVKPGRASDVGLGIVAASMYGQDRMTTDDFGRFSGALFAVNGGFAHGGQGSMNSGIVKIHGNVLPHLAVEPEELRFVGSGAFGIDDHGVIHYRLREADSWQDDWPEVHSALAGGHMLLLGGELTSPVDTEDYQSAREMRHAGQPHPRTAICTRADEATLLITVDGRHEGRAEGLTLHELGRFLTHLGCRDALNLDGGGSTTMWIDGHGVVNRPSDNAAFDHAGARLVRTAVIGSKKSAPHTNN